MILELSLVAGVATAVLAYRQRRLRAAAARSSAHQAGPGAAASSSASPSASPSSLSSSGTEPSSAPRHPGLNVSDVILYVDTELWLAGCLQLEDGADVLRLFSAPGAKRATHVAQLDRAGDDLATLSPCTDVPAGRVPDELSLGGARLRLRKRGRANVRAEGESLPDYRPQVDYVLLGDPSGRLLLVLDFVGGERLALLGEQVPSGMLDLLPGR